MSTLSTRLRATAVTLAVGAGCGRSTRRTAQRCPGGWRAPRY